MFFAKLSRRFGMENAGLWTLKKATLSPTFLEKCVTVLLLWLIFESVCKRTQLFLPLCLWNYSPMMDSNPQSDHLNDDNYAEEFNHINNTAVRGVDHDDDVDDNKKWEISQHSQVIMTAAPRQACRFIATNGHRYTNVLGITPRIWNIDECTMCYI